MAASHFNSTTLWWFYIKKMLDNCDYYILILGGKYGSLDTDGIGFTEKEYDYAVAQKIPIMSFLINRQSIKVDVP